MFGVPLHFLFVHFPIALSILAIAYDLRRQHETSYSVTGWAVVAAALAVLTGLQMGSGRIESSESILHVGSALLGTLALIVLGVLRYSARARDEDISDNYPAAWMALGILAAVAVALAAITGHRIALGR